MTVELKAGKSLLSAVAKDMDATLVGEDRLIFRLCTHSEQIKGGELFCALLGKDDGFYYIQRAKKHGAAAVLCDRVPSVDIPYILVPDVIAALGKWAHAVRCRHSVKCIAVTGSVGKTSTKNAIFSVLKKHFRTHATEGNYNNLLGVPFTVLSMPKDTEVLITELGTNRKGEIKALSKIVCPSHAVITAIGNAHIEAFGDRMGVLEEKLGILSAMETGGILFIPDDEDLLKKDFENILCLPVSPEPSAMPDIATARALGFAKSIALALGISEEDIKRALPHAKECASRRKECVAEGIYLIDDAYNASPESMLAAFSYLKSKAIGRRLLVLGDMLELGKEAPHLHREIGKAAAECADVLFLFGSFKEYYAQGAAASEKKTVIHLLRDASAKSLSREILSEIKKGDTLLFKSSHALHADEICAAIINELSRKK